MYETLPVFHREGADANVAAKIEFQIDKKWAAATDKPQTGVAAVRITRFGGAVEITFDKPRTARLSPKEWADTYLSRAVCRNVLVDLKPDGDIVRYRIAPAK